MKNDRKPAHHICASALILLGFIGVNAVYLPASAQSDQISPISQAAPTIVGAPQAPALSQKDIAALTKGNVVVDVKRGAFNNIKTTLISAAIDIAAPTDTVWRVMASCEEALNIVPHIQSCDVLDGNSEALADHVTASDDVTPVHWDVRRHIVRYSTLFPKTINEFRSVYTQNKQVLFEKSGGDLKVLRGAWRLQPINEGANTRVTYSAELAIGQPVPGFLLRRITNGDTKEILRNLRSLSQQRTLAEQTVKSDSPERG